MTYDELVAARDHALRQKESALAQANYAAGRASVYDEMIDQLEKMEAIASDKQDPELTD